MIIFDLAQKYGRYSHYPIRAGPDVFPLFTLNPGKSNPTKIAFAVPLGQLMRQCCSAFFYTSAASKFHLYQPVSTATQMHYRITLQTTFIAIMVHRSGEDIGITAQVTHSHSLKEQAHSIQISNQVIRSQFQCSNGDRRINKIMGIAAAYSHLGTQVWIPNIYVI